MNTTRVEGLALHLRALTAHVLSGQIQFPKPTLGSSQSLLTPAPGTRHISHFSGLHRYHHTYIHTHT